MSEPGTSIPISRGMEITPGSQLVSLLLGPNWLSLTRKTPTSPSRSTQAAQRTSIQQEERPFVCLSTTVSRQFIGAIPNRVRKQSIRLLMVDNG